MYPIVSKLIKIVDSLIESEPEPDQNHHKKLMWIYEKTHKEIMLPITVVELAVARNMNQKMNYEIDLEDRAFSIVHLYKILDEVIFDLTKIVVDIAKKYDVSFPSNPIKNSSDIKFG